VKVLEPKVLPVLMVKEPAAIATVEVALASFVTGASLRQTIS
jgi:hypothetical protein